MTKAEQIKDLQAQIDKIKQELSVEIQSQILPYIRAGNATCTFTGNFHDLMIKVAGEKHNQLAKLIEGTDGGWYHFGCPLSEAATIRYDDGQISIYFQFNGKTSDNKDKFVKEIKNLNIKVDFTDYKERLNREISRKQKELADVIQIETELLMP